MITREDIKNWIKQAPLESTHMLVICDTFDYKDYPKYIIHDEETIADLRNKYNVDMQKIMEIYNLKMDVESQLNQFRSWNL